MEKKNTLLRPLSSFPNGTRRNSPVSEQLHNPEITATLRLDSVTPLRWLRTHFVGVSEAPIVPHCMFGWIWCKKNLQALDFTPI